MNERGEVVCGTHGVAWCPDCSADERRRLGLSDDALGAFDHVRQEMHARLASMPPLDDSYERRSSRPFRGRPGSYKGKMGWLESVGRR